MERLIEIKGNQFFFTNSIRDNDIIRKRFDALSQKTFGLSFEDWYKNGYWKDEYIPHVLLHNNEAVANVSVNIMKLNYRGVEKSYIQLGTIMTDISYRNQGLSRYLMNVVLTEFSDKVDGVFLFANDTVLDFYPKFGFKKIDEYQNNFQILLTGNSKAEKLDMSIAANIGLLHKMAANGNPYSNFKMMSMESMVMFYCTKFMQNNVYYSSDYNAIIIAEITDDEILCYDILCENNDVILQDILATVAIRKMMTVNLGFTPSKIINGNLSLLKEEDTTLFMLNKKENIFVNKDLMFPLLSHA